MESQNVSSQEMLDRMLEDGRISEEDYERLSEAIRKPPEPPREEPPEQPNQRRALCKSWEHRVIGGVCGGIADHFNVDPVVARIGAVLIGCTMMPAILAVYLVLYYVLPWDDEAGEQAVRRAGETRWLAQTRVLFSTARDTIPPSQRRLPQLPWQVWLALDILVLNGLILFRLIVERDPLTAFTIIILDGALVYGLYRAHRWAFVLVVAICCLSVFMMDVNMYATLFGLGLGIVLLTAYPHFFRKPAEPEPAENES